MCYYNGQRISYAEYIEIKLIRKEIEKGLLKGIPPRIGFDYGQSIVLKRVEGKEDFDIVPMEWGFLPSYIRDREAANNMRRGYKNSQGQFQPPILTLNAVGEELLLPRKIFREASLARRCLVLSSGFFEWRHVYPLNKRTGQPVKTAIKYPYHIKVKGKEYFFMAGIWEPWTDRSTGEYVETFSIVTTRANRLMEQVHNSKKRMPVILSEDLAWEWLFGELTEERISVIAQTQHPPHEMDAYTIAKDFIGLPEPSAPFQYEELAEIGKA